MKYIIDIPDEHTDIKVFYTDADMKIIQSMRCEPYTESGCKVIENEVWEFASMLMNMHSDVAEDIYWSMNGGKGIGVVAEMTYQEAKFKYEEWKKQKEEEIHVGDEVFFNGGPRREKAIVLRLYQPKMYKPISDVLWVDGIVEKMVLVENLIRTGRHFDEVDELLKKMRGKQK